MLNETTIALDRVRTHDCPFKSQTHKPLHHPYTYIYTSYNTCLSQRLSLLYEQQRNILFKPLKLFELNRYQRNNRNTNIIQNT